MENRNTLFSTFQHFDHFNQLLTQATENQDTDSINEICAYLLVPDNFTRLITNIQILETFYEFVANETDNKNMYLLSSLLFQAENFNRLFNNQYSFEFIVKYCYHNHPFMNEDHKNKVFMLIRTEKINFHLFITNLCAREKCIETPDAELEKRITTRVIQIILESFANIFSDHNDIFNQPDLERVCKKIKECSPAETAYTQGAVAGMFFASTASTAYKDISIHVTPFLNRKTGAHIALTCTEAANEAEKEKTLFNTKAGF